MASNAGTPCSAKGVVEMWMDHFALELILSAQTPGQLLPVLGLFPSLDWDLDTIPGPLLPSPGQLGGLFIAM